jgi:hypothetical protein
MTHHATNLDLPGEANITTAAGDVATFQSTGANTVQCINYTKADGTSVVAAGGNAPYWYIGENAGQSVSDYTMTKMTFADGEIDSDGAYSTVNHRFTVPSGQAGKYYIYVSASYITQGDNLRVSQSSIRINGAQYGVVINGGPGGSSYSESGDTQNIAIADLSVGDYVEAWGAVDWQGASGSFQDRQFGGFKIG